jgi:hypothetical protein
MHRIMQAKTRPALQTSCKSEYECLRWRAFYARQLENKSFSHNQKAELRCQLAREYEDISEYESAREVMNGLWRRIGEQPVIEGLEQETVGEVLLRAGVLTGWIGSTQQITNAQEIAKNLLSQSIAIFESLRYA